MLLTRLSQSLLVSLRYRDNRVFWLGTSSSSVAQAAFLVSASWVAFRDGGSGAAGLVTFAVMFPFLLATPIGGLLADRRDRRQIVLVTQVLQGLLALLLGLLALAGALPLWLLVSLVLLSSVARTIELPTVGAALPNLVPPEALLNTLALNTLATLGSRFVGPAVLAPVLDLWGAGAAFLVIATLYLPALEGVRRAPPMPRAVAVERLVEQVRQGLGYIQREALVGLLLGMVILHCWLTMSFDSILPLFADDNLRAGGAIYSSLVAAGGIGAILGSALLAGLRSRRWRGGLLLGSALGSGLATAAMAVTSAWPPALAAMVAMGITQAAFMTLSTTLVQEVVPDQLRGRVTGIFLMSAGGIMSFGNLANGYLADEVGASLVLALPALVFVVIVLAIAVARPALRRVYREGTLPLPS